MINVDVLKRQNKNLKDCNHFEKNNISRIEITCLFNSQGHRLTSIENTDRASI